MGPVKWQEELLFGLPAIYRDDGWIDGTGDGWMCDDAPGALPGRPNQHIGDAGVNTDAGVATDAGVKSPASPQTSVSSVHALSDLTNRCTCVVKTDPSHLQVTLARYFTRI